ncbi:hypothetical protein EV426DRAFT_604071 [Tirmania nivea]|nr:hypothetical protein EV426DRAFT_604071 [Tirmania nivea]
MSAPGSFQQQHFQQQQDTDDVQTQQETVVYPSIMEEQQVVQPLDQSVVNDGQSNTQQPTSCPQDPLVYTPPPSDPKDEKKSGTVKRFLGDTLVGRFARSSLETTASTAKLVIYLSPWGDNNSVTLPNIRYRDIALFATSSVAGGAGIEGVGDLLGAAVGDTFASTVVDPTTDFFVNNLAAKYALFQIIEQAVDKGILQHMFPEQEKMLKTTSMRTLQCAVKHKLMDVDANIQLFFPTNSINPFSSEKGWFCPYFYASNRTPKISRLQDFGVAQCFGPFLRGDHQLAEKLLSESNTILSLCDPDPTHDTHTRRLLVTFLGITPYRAGMWSTSRRPGASLIHYHLLNGCPALVIPVGENCPITAWSPVTMSTITQFGFDLVPLHDMVCRYLDSVIRMEGVLPKLREKYDEVLSRCVSLVVNGAVRLKDAEVPREVMKKLDPERAGIAFFRY